MWRTTCWPDGEHRAEGEQYTYGQVSEKQIAEVIRMYKGRRSQHNQAYMTVGEPKAILFAGPTLFKRFDTRIKNTKTGFLYLFPFSWDLWAGFPSNLGPGIQLLKEYMGLWNRAWKRPNDVVSSKGLHIYEYCWDLAKLVVNR